MPMYTFRCCECEHEDVEFAHMKDATAVGSCVVCPKCGGSAYQRMIDLPGTDLKDFHTPIDMFSVAVDSVEEARELQRKCPDASISDDPRDENFGVPIARNRKGKLQVLKASGYLEKT